MKSKYPFIIHYCVPKKDGTEVYATHTHGLNGIGLPEFILNRRSFDFVDSAFIINCSYDYFTKPENSSLILEISNGEIVKIRSGDLVPGMDDSLTLCYRMVPSSFAAVAIAYETDDDEFDFQKLKVIQIWVDGDDYALTNKYYINDEDLPELLESLKIDDVEEEEAK
jgi:hypothetical protein